MPRRPRISTRRVAYDVLNRRVIRVDVPKDVKRLLTCLLMGDPFSVAKEIVRRFVKGIVDGLQFYRNNKKSSMEIIARYTKSRDMEKIEYGYDYNAKIYLTKPFPALKGVQLALEEIGEKNPSARTAAPEQFVDTSFVKELDERGYIDSLYK